jgi:hypothetical protein
MTEGGLVDNFTKSCVGTDSPKVASRVIRDCYESLLVGLGFLHRFSPVSYFVTYLVYSSERQELDSILKRSIFLIPCSSLFILLVLSVKSEGRELSFSFDLKLDSSYYSLV